MPTKFTYNDFLKDDFKAGISKLRNHGFKSVFTAHVVAKVCTLLEKEMDQAQELYLKTIKQYAKVAENGQFAWKEGQFGKLDIEDVKGYEKAMSDYASIEVTLPCPKIKVADLDGVSLSAGELIAITGILMDVEEEKVASAG